MLSGSEEGVALSQKPMLKSVSPISKVALVTTSM